MSTRTETALPTPRASASTENQLHWRLLRLLNLFRATASGVFVVLFFTDTQPRLLGESMPSLFLWTALVYFSFAVASSFTIRWRRPPAAVQGFAQFLADIAGITLVMHASGGLVSGLGSLLVVTLGVATITLGQTLALLTGVLAALAVLLEQLASVLASPTANVAYAQGGILGAILLATALMGTRLAHRMRESEALAARRGLDLHNLSQLNDFIIHQLQTGLTVLDGDGTIQLLNRAASQYLGIPETLRGQPVEEVSPRLAELVARWQRNPFVRPASFDSADGTTVVVPHLTRVGSKGHPGTLIFLEDAGRMEQRVQQMKLAALGRLTASIAHELRNPLGAISHANELLAESTRLSPEEERLSRIIRDASSRVNVIIENILALSRREATRPEALELNSWLQGFVEEFTTSRELPPEQLRLILPERPVAVRMDPGHLHQILWNLVDNATRYGRSEDSELTIQICAGWREGQHRPFLEVIDSGPGVSGDVAEHVFEPFYTSTPKGTGLGLFIARELCECNRARLSYQPGGDRGACFRILFADPERWIS
ncbi:MAG: ATP-binding protein [Gammaproteobacteria bacterium]|jgi:two-component system sensor histidine kinase PilS (NtrC family)